MIASKQETSSAVVRIHDEHCTSNPQATLSQLHQIISAAHKREASNPRHQFPENAELP